jgi:hypothetical protein
LIKYSLEFLDRGMVITQKLLNQGFLVVLTIDNTKYKSLRLTMINSFYEEGNNAKVHDLNFECQFWYHRQQ